MKLAKFALEIRFSQPGEAFNWKKSLVESIVGAPQENIAAPILNEVMQVALSKHKTKVTIDSTRLGIIVDDLSNRDEVHSLVFDIINRAIKNVGWKKANRIGLRTIWHEKVNTDFDSAISEIKKRNFVKNIILDEAQDVALCYTLKDGDYTVNYLAGVMTDREMIEKLALDATTVLPKLALISDTDYHTLKETNFDLDFMADFIKRAVAYGEEKARQTKEITI